MESIIPWVIGAGINISMLQSRIINYNLIKIKQYQSTKKKKK